MNNTAQSMAIAHFAIAIAKILLFAAIIQKWAVARRELASTKRALALEERRYAELSEVANQLSVSVRNTVLGGLSGHELRRALDRIAARANP